MLDVGVLAQVLFVLVVHPSRDEPGAGEEPETGSGLAELAGEEAVEFALDEFRVGAVGEVVGGWEAVPFFGEADGGSCVGEAGLLEGGVDFERRGIGCGEADGSPEACGDGDEEEDACGDEFEAGRNFADGGSWVGGTEIE